MCFLTGFLGCDTHSTPLFQREIFRWGGGVVVVVAKLLPAVSPTMASAVGGSPQRSSEDGARMSEEWLRKEKGRKTQHLAHNREQAVLGVVGRETMGWGGAEGRGGCCISSEFQGRRAGGDTSLVLVLVLRGPFAFPLVFFSESWPRPELAVNI